MRPPSPATAAWTSPSASGRSRRVAFACGLIPAMVVAVLALYRPVSLSRLDSASYDTILRWAGTRPPDGRVVIVDVDERSLATVGQWPWRRDLIGRLVSELRRRGTAIIAMDMIFAEPDRDQGSHPDAQFAAALREGGVVLGYGMTFDGSGSPTSSCALHPVSVAFVQRRAEPIGAPLFHANGAICSLPSLAQAASASGFLNAAPDADGVLRRVPLLMQLDDRIYPALALRAVAGATRRGELALEVSNVNEALLSFGGAEVPLDGKGNLLIRYRGTKKTFPFVSAADVMSGALPENMLRDKIVFVGTTALGTREVVVTPLDTLFTGVEVQATVADNLLQHDFSRRHQLGAAAESLATVAVGAAMALLVARVGLMVAVLAGAIAIVAPWVVSVWYWRSTGVFVSPLPVSVGAGSALVLMTMAKFALERRRADREGQDKSTAQRLMVQALLSLTQTRDAETGNHSRRTQQYTRLLAEQLSSHQNFRGYLTPERIELLAALAPLHDIGKVGISDRILHKEGPLTPDELQEMRKHPVYGRDVILTAQRDVGVHDDVILGVAKDIVYSHHEKWDGTGYPEGLRGPDIPIPGRLMALVDVYDASTTRTLYCQPLSHRAAVNYIVAAKGTHFDPAVVDAFLRVEARFHAVSGDAAA